MLVLTRKRLEKIMIGDNIEVTILDVRGSKVRFGIQAPREIPVQTKVKTTKSDVAPAKAKGAKSGA